MYCKWNYYDNSVDYELLYNNRESVLRKAFKRFSNKNTLSKFINNNPWVERYALFMSIKATQNQRSWIEWPEPLRMRETVAINRITNELKDDILYHVFVQYLFFNQWSALRQYVNEKGIQIIGDIPIYTALDSVDVWSNPELLVYSLYIVYIFLSTLFEFL